ncbi:MAG TPA: RecX family transcriptional regulator [Sphingomicrobium sp.]|nr:RecX family transcriptional regulator [Sphingomicrobium sp.]
MTLTNIRRKGRQLNDSSLAELALAYVGKYATSRAKLRAYLSRKIRERGWDGSKTPDLDALANRLSELGYVDDAAYALGKARSLAARGFGKRRLADKLRVDGIDESDRAAADAHADDQSLDAALRFAERRRLGPFASVPADQQQRQKWIAAMVRAGHDMAIARAIATLPPEPDADAKALKERLYVR